MSERDYDLMLLEGYISFLKSNLQDVKAVDPFAEKFAEAFPSRSPRSMRDFKRLTNLVKVHALFHFAQRPLVVRKIKLEAMDDKEIMERYIMVTRRDYDFITSLWFNIQETTETSAPGHIIRFYHDVVEELSQEKAEFGVEDLTDAWNSRFEDKKSSFTIRRWIDFLCRIGYLTNKSDPEDERRKLYKTIPHLTEKLSEAAEYFLL